MPSQNLTAGCALDVDDALHCWVGDGEELWSDPGPYTTVSTLAFIGAGLRPDGSIACWGDDCHAPPDGVGFTGIACGEDHCCATDEVNPPVCWGGDYTLKDLVYPEVALKSLYSGSWDTCGLELDGAAAWCWGLGWNPDFTGLDWDRPPERIEAPAGLTWELYTPPDWGLTSDGQILDRDGNPPPVE